MACVHAGYPCLRHFSPPTVGSIATAIAAAAALAIALHLRRHNQLGPQADWLKILCRRLLPWLDSDLENYGGYAEGEVRPEAFERRLDDMNIVRNFAASLKTDLQGRTEVGSWAPARSPWCRDATPRDAVQG